MFKSIKFFKEQSRGRVGEDSASVCSAGRSMIEMLGVLAIVGVLSVGGIAGYSKAMEMYKIDKALEEYNFLIQGLLEHSEEFVKMSKQNTQMTGITDFVKAANLVPATWKKVTTYDFVDSVGNMVGTYIRGGLWAIEIHPGGSFRSNEAGTQINESFSLRMCESIFRDLAQPLHSSVHDAFIFRSKQGSIVFLGDKNCTDGKKCLHNLTVAEINKTCKSCQKSSERCSIAIEFE